MPEEVAAAHKNFLSNFKPIPRPEAVTGLRKDPDELSWMGPTSCWMILIFPLPVLPYTSKIRKVAGNPSCWVLWMLAIPITVTLARRASDASDRSTSDRSNSNDWKASSSGSESCFSTGRSYYWNPTL